MFSYKIEESSLSDTRCCIATLVIKEWCDVHQIFSAELLCDDVISLDCRGEHINVSDINKATV